MSLSTAGVDTFLLEHPTYDGRGVIVLVFDTGVDPSIPGVQKTTTGATKVIDAIDFSRSNVVKFDRAVASNGGGAQSVSSEQLGVRLRGLEKLDPQPIDGTWYVGAMRESVYRNASVRDFDGDGISTSVFGALLYRTARGWRVAVDTDADSNIAGETSVGAFRETHETIQFRQRESNTRSPITMSATIDTAAREVSFHYDMNVHGTHVAGIATGFGINREDGFNGVAPGAQVISGKFSSDWAKDITVTGSMKRAYEYAARLADSMAAFNTPVVVNMSFGIGSAIEGDADIEKMLNDIVAAHPNLYIVTSAGNEGPGLSSVGIPAAATKLITVGALLPRGVGRDTYSAALNDDILWDFSSRGGEVDKPDIVAPGTAVSTITRFSFESRLSGTSMASPYTAGVVALLLSAMRQEDSTFVPSQALMRRVLRNSATPLGHYSTLEQGGGVVNVRRAYQLLREYRRSGFASNAEDYDITTYSPNYPDRTGPTAFWRSTYVPGDEWRQEFTISRSSDKPGEEFFRAYSLEPNVPWLSTVQSTVYMRNQGNAKVDVLYNRDMLKEPGLYTGRVIARRASASGPAAASEIEFELLNTIIVPYQFSPENDYTVTTPMQTIPAGHTRRFYFAPPPGAATLTFTLSVPKGSKSNVAGWILDRNGYNVNYLARVIERERLEGSNTVSAEALGTGVIEVVVQSDVMESAGNASQFALTVASTMLDFDVAIVGDETREAVITAVNTGNKTINGTTSITMKGYVRTIVDTLRRDTFSMPLVMRKEDGALWIQPSFDPKDYNRSTDILARLVDADGNVQAEEAFGTPSVWLFLPNFDREADSTNYRLEVIFGFARDSDLPKVPITIVEKHVRPSDPRPIDGWSGSELVPYIPQTFRGKLPATPIPAGYNGLGELIFKPRGEDTPITWEFEY
ncbi:MAG: S8 family serine peptidase [bacterium]|nr:S8 family serine peptidase [Candidatus Kapabacteria bacterium]